MTQEHPITPPPPHLLKKFSGQAREESNKRNGAGYLKTFARLCIEWAMSCQATSSLSQIRSSEIQPPPELFAEWLRQACECSPHDHSPGTVGGFMAHKAAQWGADQTQGAVNETELQKARAEELEACCEWLDREGWSGESRQLRTARRPKPPSLKEQALETLKYPKDLWSQAEVDTIRRALEGQ
jgi:hypothetical protein